NFDFAAVAEVQDSFLDAGLSQVKYAARTVEEGLMLEVEQVPGGSRRAKWNNRNQCPSGRADCGRRDARAPGGELKSVRNREPRILHTDKLPRIGVGTGNL